MNDIDEFILGTIGKIVVYAVEIGVLLCIVAWFIAEWRWLVILILVGIVGGIGGILYLISKLSIVLSVIVGIVFFVAFCLLVGDGKGGGGGSSSLSTGQYGED